MILTDGTTTFTTDDEDIQEKPIGNTSTIITRGGKRIQQGDNQVLEIRSKIRISQADLATFNSIIENFGATLTYTPVRKLAYKTSIASMTVVVQDWPQISERMWAGEVYFIVEMTLLEVVGA